MTYLAAADRYDRMIYNRCGRSGLKLPAISLGLWQNFGGDRPAGDSRAIVRRAFDLGITHFDLANNYGPPYGSAERDVRPACCAPTSRRTATSSSSRPRPGYDMWPGPYGDFGSRKYLLASLDQSLRRMGLDYVDIFYSHRRDPGTPLEETLGALDTAVRQARRSTSASPPTLPSAPQAAAILRDLGTPLLIHQPLLHVQPLDRGGPARHPRRSRASVIVFSPLGAGHADRAYLGGVPGIAGEPRRQRCRRSMLTEQTSRRSVRSTRSPNVGPDARQMALAWMLRDPRVTSVLVGASSVAQSRTTSPRSTTSTSGRSSPRSTARASRAAPSLGGLERGMSTRLRTPLWDLLGIRLPILLAGMAEGPGTPECWWRPPPRAAWASSERWDCPWSAQARSRACAETRALRARRRQR